MDVSTSGKFGGLGIVIRMIDRKLTVVKPMKDTPAWKKGIKAGDHIVKINNEPTENLTSNEAVDRMRGDPKTGVTLWVERKGEPNLLRFDLVRDVIRVSQVEHKLLDKGVGYIKVKQFSKGIASDVADAMKEMSGQGRDVVDPRPPLQPRRPARGSGPALGPVRRLRARSSPPCRAATARRAAPSAASATRPSSLVVLVNGGSASASEIVAGALKNLDRAVDHRHAHVRQGLGAGALRQRRPLQAQAHDRAVPDAGRPLRSRTSASSPTSSSSGCTSRRRTTRRRTSCACSPPTRTYGEKDLDAHLVSTYAKDTDKPAYEVPFLVEKKKTPGRRRRRRRPRRPMTRTARTTTRSSRTSRCGSRKRPRVERRPRRRAPSSSRARRSSSRRSTRTRRRS